MRSQNPANPGTGRAMPGLVPIRRNLSDGSRGAWWAQGRPCAAYSAWPPGTPSQNALGSFPRARRGLIRPEDAGIGTGGRRRVLGLGREELAMLAGISTDYRLGLEQGRDVQASAHHPADTACTGPATPRRALAHGRLEWPGA